MQIEFTVEEYFRELKLMQQQYGLEEELYPWMYMLLKMAEGRKKEILNEQYMDISIRDVHNWKNHKRKNEDQYSKEKIAVEKQLSLQQGPPDIAIMSVDEKKIHFLGCVEVKYIKTGLNLEEGEFKIKSDGIKYTFNTANDTKEVLRLVVEDDLSEDKYKELFKKAIKIDTKERFKIREPKHHNAMYEYELDLKKDSETIRNVNIENKTINMNANDMIEIIYGNEQKPLSEVIVKIPVTVERIVENWKFETQILSHLEKFKKVLYTNGLKFYFLTLKENKINVKKIADLTGSYEKYVDYHKTNREDIVSAAIEWNRLLDGLTSIDWYLTPSTTIEL